MPTMAHSEYRWNECEKFKQLLHKVKKATRMTHPRIAERVFNAMTLGEVTIPIYRGYPPITSPRQIVSRFSNWTNYTVPPKEVVKFLESLIGDTEPPRQTSTMSTTELINELENRGYDLIRIIDEAKRFRELQKVLSQNI